MMARQIGICIPTLDQVDWGFAHDFAMACGHHGAAYDDVVNVHHHRGTLLHEARNLLAKEAVEAGDDYVIFLDSDMRFPQNTLARLMDWDEPVVAANCARRRRPISPTARIIDGDDPSGDRPLWPEPGKDGLEQVDTVGTAVMCIERDVFFELEYPWFDVRYIPEKDWFMGEDLYFCAQLHRAGIPLYIDHGLSWAVRHIGQYEYGMNDVLGEKKLAEQGAWDHAPPEGAEKKPEIITPAGAGAD